MKADPLRVNPMRLNPDRRDVRRVIDTATGLLVSAHRMTHSEAYRWLQANAMKRRTSLLAVADSVIAAAGRVPPMAGDTP
jgi:AmiR/NasT family two-component response regulator